MASSRRSVLKLLGTAPFVALGGLPAYANDRRLRLTVTGQALIEHDLLARPYAGFDAVVAEIRRGDVAFTDLEMAIRTPASGAPTRTGEFFHTAGPEVLGCLQRMGFSLLSLANNHAWDLGTEGVLATRNAVAAAGFGHAGTGENRLIAAAAGFAPHRPDVALVAMAAGKIRDGAAATASRPGVNEMRFAADGTPDPDDMALNMAAIRSAARQADIVIACLHNHLWGDDMAATKPWARQFAHACLDAGASLFTSHGAPLLHGIEIHDGKPILHNLGSLIFHSRTKPGHYPPEVWQSAVVHLDFDGPAFRGLEVVPVGLNETGDDPSPPYATRGRPRLATGQDAEAILNRLATLSAAFGTRLELDQGRAFLKA